MTNEIRQKGALKTSRNPIKIEPQSFKELLKNHHG